MGTLTILVVSVSPNISHWIIYNDLIRLTLDLSVRKVSEMTSVFLEACWSTWSRTATHPLTSNVWVTAGEWACVRVRVSHALFQTAFMLEQRCGPLLSKARLIITFVQSRGAVVMGTQMICAALHINRKVYNRGRARAGPQPKPAVSPLAHAFSFTPRG